MMFSDVWRGCRVLWRRRLLFVVCDYGDCDTQFIECKTHVLTWLPDFIVTIPFSFIAERWGIRVVLWCNLVPRFFMSAWAIVIGMCEFGLWVFTGIIVLNIANRSLSTCPPHKSYHCGSFSECAGRRMCLPIHNLYLDFSADERICSAVRIIYQVTSSP